MDVSFSLHLFQVIPSVHLVSVSLVILHKSSINWAYIEQVAPVKQKVQHFRPDIWWNHHKLMKIFSTGWKRVKIDRILVIRKWVFGPNLAFFK
jgi:hypothetical protein